MLAEVILISSPGTFGFVDVDHGDAGTRGSNGAHEDSFS